MIKKIKNVYIFGGGTVDYIGNHFCLSAPAYGSTAKKLYSLACEKFEACNVYRELTKMADQNSIIETTQDLSKRIDVLIKDPNTKVIFFTCAIPDYTPLKIKEIPEHIFSKKNRLESKNFNNINVEFAVNEKIIAKIRKERKDITLISFKTTCGATNQEMYEKGLNLCKRSSSNLVLVNDVVRRHNMIVTPEEASYHETEDRWEVLENLVDMAWHRSHLTFTRSTVVDSKTVDWNSEEIPNSLRTIVNHAISKRAYKPFNNSTVGHFAFKKSDTEFITSIRKSNFNDLDKIGMVYVKTDGPDTVLAYGAKPSVGGQSQRIIFKDHKEMDSVVHFHCPLKKDHPDEIPVVSQREVECGSHECGKNTSDNLKQFGDLKCVMLDRHGPNIVFNSKIDPEKVIKFIDRNFDLDKKTGGYNLL